MSQQREKKVFLYFALIIGFILINLTAAQFYSRIDLTKEKRHSLSEASRRLISQLDDVVYVKVYLEGDFPAGFTRLRNATEDVLEEFKAFHADHFAFEFINPFEGADEKETKAIFAQLQKKGLTPTRIDNIEQTSVQNQYIFPGALISYQGEEVAVKLLQSQLGVSPSQALNNSVSGLEYALISGIKQLVYKDKPRVGIVTGHGELDGQKMADFITSLQEFYRVQKLETDSLIEIPSVFTSLIIAKPTQTFSEQEKYKIDQYIMRGGNVLWLIDQMIADMDSLKGKAAFAVTPRELNLEDQFFQYGARINSNVVQDMQCAPHPFVTGYNGNIPQQQLFDWIFYPVIVPQSKHPIVNNMDAIIQKFPSSIDTVGAPNIKKQGLLHTSKYSRNIFTGARVSLDVIQNKPQPGQFNKPYQMTAVLLEGKFNSLYGSRAGNSFVKSIEAATGSSFRKQSSGAKQIIVADGDMVENSFDRQGNMYPAGFYPYTGNTFANKKFLMNSVEYLSDPSGIMEANAKSVTMRPLDTTRIKREKTKWQMINLFIPILLIVLFGITYNYIRFRKYKSIE